MQTKCVYEFLTGQFWGSNKLKLKSLLCHGVMGGRQGLRNFQKEIKPFVIGVALVQLRHTIRFVQFRVFFFFACLCF